METSEFPVWKIFILGFSIFSLFLLIVLVYLRCQLRKFEKMKQENPKMEAAIEAARTSFVLADRCEKIRNENGR